MIDEEAAKKELTALSRNARRWLEDRVGNRLCAISGFTSIGMHHRVEEGVEGLMEDFQKIGCFALYRAYGRKGGCLGKDINHGKDAQDGKGETKKWTGA